MSTLATMTKAFIAVARILVTSSVLLAAVAAGAAAAPASAAEQPAGFDRFSKAQATREFVVYAPTNVLGLPLTSFRSYACGNPGGPQLSAQFGSRATSGGPRLQLSESPAPGCVDGPDGVGPAATFTFEGAKVTVYGECANGRSTCARSTAAGVTRQAYTTVTLPGSAVRPTPTLVELYSSGVSIAQIRTFIRGLVPAT